MNRFAKRYEEDTSTYSDYDKARAAMANTVRSYPARSYSFRTVGNTDSFEKEYQAFINKLKAQKEEKAVEETSVVEETKVEEVAPIVEETPVVEETPSPKKRKSKVTVEETVATDDTLFG
jgi:hypothetical protein